MTVMEDERYVIVMSDIHRTLTLIKELYNQSTFKEFSIYVFQDDNVLMLHNIKKNADKIRIICVVSIGQ